MKLGKKDEIAVINQYRRPVMGIAALSILYFHAGIIVGEGFLVNLLLFIRRIGYLGVDVFLFLSGIGIVYSHENNGRKMLTFWKRRFQRIFLPMLIMALCYCLTEHWSVREFIENITGYHFYMVQVEKSFLWFYFAIFSFYFFFPFYYKLLEISPNKEIFTVMMLCVWLALSMAVKGYIRDDLYWMIDRIPIFLTGILLGWRQRNGKAKSGRGIWLIMSAVLILAIYMEYKSLVLNQLHLIEGLGFIPGYMAGISLAFLWAKGLSLLDGDKSEIGKSIIRVCSFFGMISYELYCVQEWIFGIFVSKFLDRISVIMLDIIIFIACVGAGLVIYRLNQWFWKGCQYIFSKKE